MIGVISTVSVEVKNGVISTISVEVKNDWSSTPSNPSRLHDADTDNFTFTPINDSPKARNVAYHVLSL